MKKDIKTVVFISNYFNHHQRPFSDAMYGLLGGGYTFLETESITQERLNMGWGEHDMPDYVIPVNVFTEQKDEIQQLIDSADVVIFGSAPSELLRNRIRDDRMIFRYSERPLKVRKLWKYPFRLFTWRKAFPQKKNTYILCASAYTAGDYASFGLFRNRCYKWGYFPVTKIYDVNALFAQKCQNKWPSILWAGRLIEWKHPDASILLAERLRAMGCYFDLDIIGNGDMQEELKAMIQEKGLNDCVHLLGAMSPERVRVHMERADIFLFTSDFNEGWGAVLNESMNSGCAVVASHAIGSVPFLIQDERNGLIYESGNIGNLVAKVENLIREPEFRQELGREAYKTITEVWNARMAAKCFLKLANGLRNGERMEKLITDGPCEKAPIIKNHWYKG